MPIVSIPVITAGDGTGPLEVDYHHEFRSLNLPSPAASNELSLTTSFTGIDISSGTYPADPSIAAGPASLVLVTNGSVVIRDKAGILTSSAGTPEFWAPVRTAGENAGGDPRVLFDPATQRFFITAIARVLDPSCTPGNCVSHIFLAVSKTSMPATVGMEDWWLYSFDATLDGTVPTNNWADFPALGVNDKIVVVTAQMISQSTGANLYPKIRIFDKAKLIRGEAVSWTDFVGMKDPINGSDAMSFRPALHFENSGKFLLISISRNDACRIVVWGIINELSSPTLTSRSATISGGNCGPPPNAPQAGAGTAPIFPGSNGLQGDVVYRNNSLWNARGVSANFGSGNVAAIRWFQIDVSQWPASVSVVQDSMFGTDGIWSFFPAIMVDRSNNVAIVYNRASASEFGSVYYTGRLSTDPHNSLRPASLLKAGNIALAAFGSNHASYGDYCGTALDPNNGSIWIFGEYVRTSDAWGTWVGNLVFQPKASPTPTATPGTDVAVSGRVLTPDGRGLRNATVSITDANNTTRTAITSSFGNYIFTGVQTGNSYPISVSSKRYRFASRIVVVNGVLTDVDFVGLE